MYNYHTLYCYIFAFCIIKYSHSPDPPPTHQRFCQQVCSISTHIFCCIFFCPWSFLFYHPFLLLKLEKNPWHFSVFPEIVVLCPFLSVTTNKPRPSANKWTPENFIKDLHLHMPWRCTAHAQTSRDGYAAESVISGTLESSVRGLIYNAHCFGIVIFKPFGGSTYTKQKKMFSGRSRLYKCLV